MCAVQKIRYGILMRSRFPLGKPTELIRVQLYVSIPDLRCLFEVGGSGLCSTLSRIVQKKIQCLYSASVKGIL